MSEQPNLLLITTDQQRFDALCAAGNPHIMTPHLDWLADTGILFTRCYTDAPVCAPARSTMITGRHFFNQPAGIGHFNQPSAADRCATYPAVLTRGGYQTRLVGKGHYHPERCNYGWEHVELLEDYYRHMARHPERGLPMEHGLGQNEMHPVISTVHENHSLTHWTVGRSIEFLETRDTTRPFCLYTSFSKPHPPFDPCLNYWLLYADANLPEPWVGDWSREASRIDDGWLQPTWALNGADQFSPDMVRRVRRAYYALVTQIDYNLGLLLARMREMGLFENTLIVFTADHGEMLGDHHAGAKTVFLEGSAHVPMIVRPPSGPGWEGLRGKRCDGLVCLADIMATFGAAAGVPMPENDGLDLVAVARGEARRERFFGTLDRFHCVIEGRLKYLFCDAGGSELMFDLEADPREEHDLVRAGTHHGERLHLRALLADHLQKIKSPAAAGGELLSTREAVGRKEQRANPWPGFHSRNHPPFDVLH